MKSLLTTILIALLAFAVTAQTQAQNLTLLDKSTMQIDGTSTIKDWTADVSEFSATLTLNSEATNTEETANFIESFSLTVPVEKIKSGKSGMDSKIYSALKEKKHPTINFTLNTVDVTGQESGSTLTMNATGELSIAGISRTISLAVESSQSEDGTITFMGSHELNMKDYDIEPPSAVFGTIKSAEEVTISFELFFNS